MLAAFNRPANRAPGVESLYFVGGSAHPGGGVPLVQRVQWMAVPEFLTEELWERHGYSLSDVRKTVDAFPARVIWQLVRSYNYPATNASSRVYCAEVRPPANLVEPRAQHVNKRAKVTPFARRQKGSQATFCNQKREVGL